MKSSSLFILHLCSILPHFLPLPLLLPCAVAVWIAALVSGGIVTSAVKGTVIDPVMASGLRIAQSPRLVSADSSESRQLPLLGVAVLETRKDVDRLMQMLGWRGP